MNPNHVVSLEWAKKLKEVGYPQEGEFWWNVDRLNSPSLKTATYHRLDIFPTRELFVAPLASELMERLPFELEDLDGFWHLCIFKGDLGYGIEYRNEILNKYKWVKIDKELCNALAKMYIYLKENKLI